MHPKREVRESDLGADEIKELLKQRKKSTNLNESNFHERQDSFEVYDKEKNSTKLGDFL